MTSLFPRLFRRRKDASALIAEFLKAPEHGWIRNDPQLLRRMAGFFCRIPEPDLALALEEKRLLMLYCNQRMSAAFQHFQGREIILVFPELRRLLLSAEYLQAYAILAHELGHILADHVSAEVEPLKAQLEADQYAIDLGLKSELAAVLRCEEPTKEVQNRLKVLE